MTIESLLNEILKEYDVTDEQVESITRKTISLLNVDKYVWLDYMARLARGNVSEPKKLTLK